MKGRTLGKLNRVWSLFVIISVLSCASNSKNKINRMDTSAPGSTNLEQLLSELKKNPKDPNLYYRLSKVYVNLDSLDYALAAIDTSLSLQPEFNEAKLMRGDLLIKKNRIKEGYTEYLEVLKSQNGDEFISNIRENMGQPYPIYQLSTGDYNNAYPSYSIDGSRIAFQSDRDGNWEIYLMDADGAQEVRITNNDAQDEMPVFGPKGNILAFTSTADDSANKGRLEKTRNIFLLNMEEGKIARLTESDADDWYPAVAENGRYVAFCSERDDRREVPFHERWSDVYIKDLKENSLLRLTQNEADDGSPAFSSNDKWLLFTSDRTGSYQVYKMDKGGNLVEQLTFMKGNCGAPHYSHDGKKITFFAEVNGVYNIYMMDSDGSRVTQLTNSQFQDSYPTFSPDKRKIMFQSNRTGKFQIYWIDLMNPFTHDELVRELEDKIVSAK